MGYEMIQPPTVYKLSDKISFGKYGPGHGQHRTIRWIIRNDPQYLDWCLTEIKGFELDNEAEVELDMALDQ